MARMLRIVPGGTTCYRERRSGSPGKLEHEGSHNICVANELSRRQLRALAGFSSVLESDGGT